MPKALFVGAATLLALALVLLFSKTRTALASTRAGIVNAAHDTTAAHRGPSFQPAGLTSAKARTTKRANEDQREQVRQLLEGVIADLKSREAARYQHLRSLENDLAESHLGVISPAGRAERIEFTAKSDQVLSVLEEPARNLASLSLQALQEEYLFPENNAKVLLLKVPADHTQPATLVTTMTSLGAAKEYQEKIEDSTNTDVLPLIEGANRTSQLSKLDGEWRYSQIFPAQKE